MILFPKMTLYMAKQLGKVEFPAQINENFHFLFFDITNGDDTAKIKGSVSHCLYQASPSVVFGKRGRIFVRFHFFSSRNYALLSVMVSVLLFLVFIH